MAELVKALIQVRDGLSLVAFLSLVLLVAFRTQKVPELFFGLVRDKLTRQHFSQLLNRFLYLGFAAFVISALLAVVGQVLNSKTQPGTLTLDDLRHELNGLKKTTEEKLSAESNFATGIELISKADLDGAIASLQKSLAAVPTLTAKETLAFLYRQKREFDKANAFWNDAMKTARDRGDPVAQARLDRGLAGRGSPAQKGETDLIGPSTPLPKGGDRFEIAPTLPQGLYLCASDHSEYFKLWLQGGQRLVIRFRNSDRGMSNASVNINDTNGALKASAMVPWNQLSGIGSLEWSALATGWHYVLISAPERAVYRIIVHE